MSTDMGVGSRLVARASLPGLMGLVLLAPLAAQGSSAGTDREPGIVQVASDVGRFAWADGGRRLLYSVYSPAPEEERWAVQSAEIERRWDGFPITWLGWGYTLLVSPDGGQVAFTTLTDLMCGPVDGSLPAASMSAGTSGSPRAFAFDPSSSWLAFTMQWSTDEGLFAGGLFSHHVAGGATISLTEPPGQPLFARAGPPVISPDGSRVVYTWSHTYNRLQSVPIDRSLPPLGLTPTGYDSIWSYQVTPDSSTVVFVSAVYPSPHTLALYRVPIDGSASPAHLAPPQSATGYVDRAFLLGPGGKDVFYLSDDSGEGDAFELWTVPLDPSRGSVAVRLSPKAVYGGGVARAVPLFDDSEPVHEYRPQFALAPGGARVVYLADQDIDEVFELFSVPGDGSGSPAKLNSPLGPGESVPPFGFRIHPDGKRVVYAAPDDGGALRLWAVPIDASSAPIALGGPYVAGGSLWLSQSSLGDGARLSFELTGDGERVVYLADQRSDETIELFVAPLDGSRPARRLNGPLVPGGDVRSPEPHPKRAFALSPDGRRVAYLADQEVDELYALYVSSLDLPRVRPARPPASIGD